MPQQKKRCPKCGKEKALRFFYATSRYCRVCHRAYMAARYDPDYQREWRAE